MPRLLILFAHPVLEKSRVHSHLLQVLKGLPQVTLHDLFEHYPDYDIDINAEQQLLLTHDIIAWQHPFYWYSAPAIIKQWMDLVLEHGWAYGSEGVMLQGKKALNILSSGGPLEAYGPEGRNRYTYRQFLAPFEQSARLCKMQYLPPFVVPGTHRLAYEGIAHYGGQYRRVIEMLTRLSEEPEWEKMPLLNDWIQTPTSVKS